MFPPWEFESDDHAARSLHDRAINSVTLRAPGNIMNRPAMASMTADHTEAEPATVYLVLKDERDRPGAAELIGWTFDKAQADTMALELSIAEHKLETERWAGNRYGVTVMPFDATDYRAYFVESVPYLVRPEI